MVDDPDEAHDRVMKLGASVLKEAEDGSRPTPFGCMQIMVHLAHVAVGSDGRARGAGCWGGV